MAQPTAMPMSKNISKDQAMYFTRAMGRRRLRNPNATETASANNTIPWKCVNFISTISIQAFRPRAAS